MHSAGFSTLRLTRDTAEDLGIGDQPTIPPGSYARPSAKPRITNVHCHLVGSVRRALDTLWNRFYDEHLVGDQSVAQQANIYSIIPDHARSVNKRISLPKHA